MAALIQFRDVSKTFGEGDSAVHALRGITVDIEAGDIFAIIGGSGAGKSTLVRMINALEKASAGHIVIEGTDITTLSERELRGVRSRMGMIFQQFNLMRSRHVYGNVAYPLKIAKWPKEKQKERVTELLNFVGLVDKAWSYPDQLSGGQKQRVGIARALATNPSILLADESTSALDPETTEDVLRLLQRVNSELGVTVVVITHEMDVVRSIANRVAVLERGELIELGSVYEVFSRPKAQTTRKFVESALRDRPDGVDVERLRRRHEGRLVLVDVTNDDRIGRVLAHRARVSDLEFDFVFGGITSLHDGSFGKITLELVGSAESVEQAVADLRAVTVVEDVA
jgi:D-methionine transport system ATP-binding protein